MKSIKSLLLPKSVLIYLQPTLEAVFFSLAFTAYEKNLSGGSTGGPSTSTPDYTTLL